MNWQTSWTQALTDVSAMQKTLDDVTVRMRPTATIGGDVLRFELNNHFGTEPVVIGRAVVTVDDRSIEATFDGAARTSMPAGGSIVSDPIEAEVAEGSELLIDVYLPDPTPYTSGNVIGSPFQISEPGDFAGSPDFPATADLILETQGTEIALSAPFLRSVEVAGREPDAVVVCFGDSITVMGWPAIAAAMSPGVAVLNRGLAGNRLRFDPLPIMAAFGRSGLSRFDDDVLAVAGATHVVVALGTNDLGHPGAISPIEELPTAADLIAGYQELITRGEEAGLRVVFTTITPSLAAPGFDEQKESIRLEVNEWIRTSAPAFVDFDAALRSEDDPSQLTAEYDSGDHLHPSEAGQLQLGQTMAAAIAGWSR